MSNFAISGFIFVFARKKFVVCLVAKVFCSTFALAFQRRGVWLSLKKAIFEKNSIDFYAEEAERVSIRGCLVVLWIVIR